MDNKLKRVTIPLDPPVWTAFKELQKKRGVVLSKAVADLFKKALGKQ